MIKAFVRKFNDIAVFTQQDIFFGDTHQNTQLRMGNEVSVLTVYRNKELWLHN